MESLERFAQNQVVIEEFTTRWLAPISGDMGRLVHVSGLRNLSSGHYSHPSLEHVYSEPAVHEALLYCHEELFAKVLEKPLEQQERDLRVFLAGMDAPTAEVVERWREVDFFRTLVPLGTPAYLRDLFFSNLRVILGLIVTENATMQTAA